MMDGNMDACRPHGHIPSLLVLFGDRFWLVCRLHVEDTKLPVENTKLPVEVTVLPLSFFREILLTYNALLTAYNYSMEIRFIFFYFFWKTTRAPHRGFHPNCLPWTPPEEVFT